MRRALTLIELILSMVIIGIVFTVIPRLIISMNQSTQTTIKEEALYNAMAHIGMIINLPWDNTNTQNSQILRVTSGNGAYECNTTSGYRKGGFIGGRNCIEPAGNTYSATAIGQEDTEYNDLDDYATTTFTADKNCSGGIVKGLFTIQTAVSYVDDPSAAGDAILSTNPAAGTSNTKYVQVQVGYGPDSQHTGCIGALEYHSFNLGNIQINSREWN